MKKIFGSLLVSEKKGFIEKSKLTAEYLSSSFSLYRNMREDSLKILTKCKEKNKRIVSRIRIYKSFRKNSLRKKK